MSLGLFGLLTLGPAGCSADQGPSGLADVFNGDWDRPPLDPPGGGGNDDGGSSTGGEGGSDPSGSSEGTGADSTGGDSGDGSETDWSDGGGDGDSGGDGDGEDAGDGDGDIPCFFPAEGESCQLEEAICEAAPLGPDLPAMNAPCCEDLDCMCADNSCVSPACQSDGYCDCACPTGDDPDCDESACLSVPPNIARDEGTCEGLVDPVVLYMSNDDSNSQASPILARRTISEGGIVDRTKVRPYEFLNYYNMNHANPTNAAVDVGVQLRVSNAEAGEFVLLLAAQGRRIKANARPPLNLVFSVDTSGSMEGDAIDLLRDSLRAAASQLRAGDIVSLVEWSNMTATILDGHPVSGPDDPLLLSKINALNSGGGTDLNGGLVRAYDVAESHYISNGINRVFLVSDGGANLGVTSAQLIGEHAQDADGEGIFLVGVGVGAAYDYSDQLMDAVTDAGKGAYIFIDSTQEAEHMFGDADRFLSNIAVAARDVQMEITLPPYFQIKEFSGEEFSEDPAEVDPQHLSPNDAMNFHQVIGACDASAIDTDDEFTAKVTYTDPLTGEELTDSATVTISGALAGNAAQLYKADVVVAYAQALIVIDHLRDNGQPGQAIEVCGAMQAWIEEAASALNDAELQGIADLMEDYENVLEAS